MPGFRATSSALVAAVCALTVAACGGDDEGTIPQDTGDALLRQLDQVEAAVEARECDTAHGAAVEFSEQASNLPSEVDTDVRNALVSAGSNLVELADTKCEPPDTGATGDIVVPETPEETAPEETTEQPEEPAEEPTEDTGPPEHSNAGGNGNSGGGGNSGGDSGGGGDDGSSGGIGSEG